MKIAATSDLHGHLPWIPFGVEMILIAGDICPDLRSGEQLEWLDRYFRPWLEKQEARWIVGIAGNHDFVFEKMKRQIDELYLPWIYLQDEEVELEGIRIWGSPWVPNLIRWAFYMEETDARKYYSQIPSDLDILVSHGPPFRHCDLTVPRYGALHAGSPELEAEMTRLDAKLLLCGHIHEGFGSSTHPCGTEIWNVSHNTENYMPTRKPVIFEYDQYTRTISHS